MDENAFRCSLELPKSSGCFLSVFIIAIQLAASYWFITPLFCLKLSSSLGVTRMFFKILPLQKYICTPYFLHIFLMLSHSPCVWGDNYVSPALTGWFCVVLVVCVNGVTLCVVFVLHPI